MITYKAVSSNSIDEFNRQCNSVIQAGFLPLGSISTCYFSGAYSSFHQFTQAFTYEDSINRQST